MADRFTKIVNLITEHNLELKDVVVPNYLKCVHCALILKDACQVPCGCKLCRSCIDSMQSGGFEFCRGTSPECKESLLSHSVPDYQANKKISNLIVKCPQLACSYECQLANIEDHLRVCPGKNAKCPFHELGCKYSLTGEEINAHLQEENWSHNKILIQMISNLNNEVAILRRNEENNKTQMGSVITEFANLRDENSLLKLENNRIKERIDDWTRQFGNSLDTEIRRVKSNLESSVASIEHRISDVVDLIETKCEQMTNQHLQVDDAVGSSGRRNSELSCASTGTGRQTNVEFLWQLPTVETRGGMMESDCFEGLVLPYRYRLRLWNYEKENNLGVRLYIQTGSTDTTLAWPFVGIVTITISPRLKLGLSKVFTQHCRIDNPSGNCFGRCSDTFKFDYSDWLASGIMIERGLSVTCIVDID